MRKKVCEGVRQAQRESERVWEREREEKLVLCEAAKKEIQSWFNPRL